ncbi:MAG: hypothetical protein PHX88_10410 [Methanoculleus horonobensis]|nr:hypothetical protein [Methanoculleus horonobensis]
MSARRNAAIKAQNAAIKAHNAQVRSYTQYRETVTNAVNNHMHNQVNAAAARLQARANEAAAQAQAQADAYDFITAAMNRIRAKACEGIGSAVMGAFGVVKGIHVRNVPAAGPAASPEKHAITKWSDGPAAAIVFEQAPR